jgi:asparagine synthase (glutamine-hydrolysing)
MCGIAGIFRNTTTKQLDVDLVGEMLRVQHHRGPDASGIKETSKGILGHNRLSILDLSEHANQPFDYKHVSLVFNGEVYNYIELKEELQNAGFTFKTTSDTEVICAAYLAWGESCVTRFVGMWAFALWDNDKQLLFCSRDRFGIKPFYYIEDEGSFYFASELNTLRVLPVFDGTPNKRQIARGLSLGTVGYKDETYYKNVKQLRSAYNLVWTEGVIETTNYWDLEKVTVPANEAEAIAKFKQMFEESLRLHMRSDVPIGSALSGGIDSSAIVASIASMHKDLDYKTFTIYYSGKDAVDERPFAEQLPKKYSNVKPFYKEPTDEEIEASFDKFMAHIDIPPSSSSFYSQYFVMKLASEHKMKVLINGQGSDEYLVGYMHTYYRILADYLRKGKLVSYARTLYQHAKEHEVSSRELVRCIGLSGLLAVLNENKYVQLELARKFKKIEGYDYSDDCIFLETKFKNRTDNFLYHLIMTTTLPTLLLFEDRNSMAFGIESRVPFLDHRLVEYGFSLPIEWRLKNGLTKFALREACKDVLPEKIYKRKDKKGFVTPGELRWANGPLKKYFTKQDSNPILNWRLNMLNLWLAK